MGLKESLELYVKGDILDGDNKWLCSKCDKKRAALKRSCFGKLSKYLILHLSRFEFDFNAMRRKKLNSRFEFPFNLNMEKYTKEGLARAEAEKEKEKQRDLEKKKKKNKEKKDDEEEEEEEVILETHPPEYYEYKLVGVIVHTGGAEAGHYYSYAQSSDGKWWEFNDVDVLPFDVNDLDKETFGGKHFVTMDDAANKNKKVRREVDKPYNAYMLIYKQQLVEKAAAADIKSFEEENNALTLPDRIQQTIWTENLKFLCDKNVFDFDYLTFLWQTVQLAQLRSSTVELTEGLQAIQIATCYVFEILVRAKDNGTFPRWMRTLYRMYQQSEIGRKWFLNKVATQQTWFINSMFFNAHKPARLAFADLLLAICSFQAATDRNYYSDFLKLSEADDKWPNIEDGQEEITQIIRSLDADKFCVARFIVSMLRFLHFVPKFHRSYQDFFKLLLGIGHIGWQERSLLISLGGIRSIVAFYLNDTPILHFNRQVVGRNDSGQRQTRRIAPPRVSDIIKLLSLLVRSSSTQSFPLSNNQNVDIEDMVDLPPEDPTEEEKENEEKTKKKKKKKKKS